MKFRFWSAALLALALGTPVFSQDFLGICLDPKKTTDEKLNEIKMSIELLDTQVGDNPLIAEYVLSAWRHDLREQEEKHRKTVDLALLEGLLGLGFKIDSKVRYVSGEPPYSWGVRGSDLSMNEKLSALGIALVSEDLNLFLYLIQKGADPNQTWDYGPTKNSTRSSLKNTYDVNSRKLTRRNAHNFEAKVLTHDVGSLSLIFPAPYSVPLALFSPSAGFLSAFLKAGVDLKREIQTVDRKVVAYGAGDNFPNPFYGRRPSLGELIFRTARDPFSKILVYKALIGSPQAKFLTPDQFPAPYGFVVTKDMANLKKWLGQNALGANKAQARIDTAKACLYTGWAEAFQLVSTMHGGSLGTALDLTSEAIFGQEDLLTLAQEWGLPAPEEAKVQALKAEFPSVLPSAEDPSAILRTLAVKPVPQSPIVFPPDLVKATMDYIARLKTFQPQVLALLAKTKIPNWNYEKVLQDFKTLLTTKVKYSEVSERALSLRYVSENQVTEYKKAVQPYLDCLSLGFYFDDFDLID